MTPWQLGQAIQANLRARDWEGNVAYQNVFSRGSTRISPIVAERLLSLKSFPLCLIGIGNATHDPQTPTLLDQTFDVVIVTGIPGDEMGENAVIGGGRPAPVAPLTSSQGQSGGRGITEVEEEFWAVVALMSQDTGIQIQGNAVSAAVVQEVAGLGFVVSRQYSIRATCTTMRTYLNATALVASAATGGAVTLAWTPAPTQWDTFAGSGGQVIRYAAGSTPPATRSAGLAGPTVTGVASGAVQSGLASGMYSFSLFTAYNETGGASPDRWSDPNSITVAVP